MQQRKYISHKWKSASTDQNCKLNAKQDCRKITTEAKEQTKRRQEGGKRPMLEQLQAETRYKEVCKRFLRKEVTEKGKSALNDIRRTASNRSVDTGVLPLVLLLHIVLYITLL